MTRETPEISILDLFQMDNITLQGIVDTQDQMIADYQKRQGQIKN